MKSALGLASISLALLAACGPTGGNDYPHYYVPDAGPPVPDAYIPPTIFDAGACVPTGAEQCDDFQDNDCDGKFDCGDPDCSGIGGCPVCGQVDVSAGSGIVLPDGIIGTPCTTDADCTDPSVPNCVESECHASYTSTLNVVGFADEQIFDSPDVIESVCVNMEHSYLRDMEMRLIAPGGQILRLQAFLGRTGGEVYLGEAYDCDEGAPTPGVGATYCWISTMAHPTMLESADAGGMLSVPSCSYGTADELPPGDYAASDPWTVLDGTPLNGEWKFVVTDLWPIDNGYLFDWTISFNPESVVDCSQPIVE